MPKKLLLKLLLGSAVLLLMLPVAIAAPAIEVLEEPPNRAQLTPGEFRVYARITSEIGIDPGSIELTLNDKVISQYTFTPQTGEFSFVDYDLPSDIYTMVLRVSDISGEEMVKAWTELEVRNPSNLLINPSIEAPDPLRPTVAPGWIGHNNWVADYEDVSPGGGNNSFRNGVGMYNAMTQIVPVVPGATYVLSWWAKSANRSQGRVAFPGVFDSYNYATSEEWRQETHQFIIPEEVEQLNFGFMPYQALPIWVDQVTLRRVDILPPTISEITPLPSSTDNSGMPIISARIQDELQGTDIDLNSLRITLNGQQLSFNYDWDTRIVTAILPTEKLDDGTYEVVVSVADRAAPIANTARKSWSFTVYKTYDLVADKMRIAADGQETSLISAIFRDVEEGTLVTFSTDLGELTQTEVYTDREGFAQTELKGQDAGIATVTVKEGERQLSIPVELYAGECQLVLAGTLLANGTDQMQLQIKALNMYGEPAAGAAVSAQISGGEVKLESDQLNSQGMVAGIIIAGTETGEYQLTVRVETSTHTFVETASVLFVQGSIESKVNTSIISASSSDSAQIRLILKDMDDQLVPDGTVINYTTSLGLLNGKMAGTAETSDGEVILALKADQSGLAVVTINWGLVVEEIEIHVVDSQKMDGILYLQTLPNPFSPKRDGEMRTSYLLSKPYFVQATIYNLAGRKVRTLLPGEMQAGNITHTLVWDGKTDGGQSVRNGLYLLYIKTDSEIWAVRRIAVFD